MDKYRQDIFKKEGNTYTFSIDPEKEYKTQIKFALSEMFEIPDDELDDFIDTAIKEKGIKEVEVFRYKYNKKGEESSGWISIRDYITNGIEQNYIITPTLTMYYQPTEKNSLHSDFTTQNKENRSKEKKKAFEYKVVGNFEKFNYHNTLQKTLKIYNNSLSGAYVSKSTVIGNESAHSVLTSVTRCVTSIGNGITEDMIAGNRQYRNPDVTMNHLTDIVTKVDYKRVMSVIKKYKIYIPNNREIIEVIKKNTDKYFTSSTFNIVLENFVEKLNAVGRCAIVYNTSIYNMALFNETLIKGMIEEISTKRDEYVEHPLIILTGVPSYITNLVHHICMEEIRGKKIKYYDLQEKDPKLLNLLASTAKHIYNSLLKYEDLFKAFFITDSYPPSMSYIPEIQREAVIVSDTDSTIATYQWWVNWILGSLELTPKAIAVMNTLTTINSAVIEHFIYSFVTTLNVHGDRRNIMAMKPEFTFPVFVNANVSKTYYSNFLIQEGNVLSEPEHDIKGVHLIGSNLPPVYSKQVHEFMEEIFNRVMSGKRLRVYEYIERVKRIEVEILEKIDRGDGTVYPVKPIKEEEAYKKGRYDSPYYFHLLWDKVFKSKYGMSDTPPYSSVSVNLDLGSKKKVREFLESIDSGMAMLIKEMMNEPTKVGEKAKEKMTSIRVPYITAVTNGIPDELVGVVDKEKVVSNICNAFYIILETIGFYKKPNMLISDYL